MTSRKRPPVLPDVRLRAGYIYCICSHVWFILLYLISNCTSHTNEQLASFWIHTVACRALRLISLFLHCSKRNTYPRRRRNAPFMTKRHGSSTRRQCGSVFQPCIDRHPCPRGDRPVLKHSVVTWAIGRAKWTRHGTAKSLFDSVSQQQLKAA